MIPFSSSNANQDELPQPVSNPVCAKRTRQRRRVFAFTASVLTFALASTFTLTACSSFGKTTAKTRFSEQQLPPIQIVSSATPPQDSAPPPPPAVAEKQLLVRQNGDAPATDPRYLGYALIPNQNDFNNALAQFVTTSWYDRPELIQNENPYLTSLNVRWSLPVNQGTVIGERLDLRWYRENQELLSESRSFYTQIGLNSLVRDDELIAPTKREALAKAIYRELAHSGKLKPQQPSTSTSSEGASQGTSEGASQGASRGASQGASQGAAQTAPKSASTTQAGTGSQANSTTATPPAAQQNANKPDNPQQQLEQACKVVSPQELLQPLQLRNDGSAIVRIPPQLLPEGTNSPVWAVIATDKLRGYLSPAGTQIENAILAARTTAQQKETVQIPAASAQLQALAASSPVPQSLQAPPNCRVLKCVALTFDDGPSENTRKLIQELQAAHAPATFFYVGQYVAADPETVNLALAAGITVGSHSYTHPNLEELSPQQVEEELVKTIDVIRTASGGTYTPFLLRPPYGNAREREQQIAARLGSPIITWNVDTEDWKNRDSQKTQNLLFKSVRPGSIILMHDVYKSSVAATPEIIKRLRESGYTLVSVTDLLLGSMKPGQRSCAQGVTGNRACGAW